TMSVGIGNQFAGKWVIKAGILKFGTDADGTFGDPVTTSGLGAPPAAFVADGVTLDGGGLYSDGDGIINKNRGVTVTANGATLWIGGEFIFNPKVTGPGDLLVVRTDPGAGSRSKNVSFNADNDTYH